MTGKELRERRKALQLNQTELGNLLGVRQNTVARWERGEVAFPDYLELALKQIEADLIKKQKT